MNRASLGVLIISCAALLSSACEGAEIRDGFIHAHRIRVRYFDSEGERRSDFDVGDVDSDSAEFDVSIDCAAGCHRRTIKIYNALSHLREITNSCKRPFYARIDLGGSKLGGPIYVDRSGNCVSYMGRSWYSGVSINRILRRASVADW